MMQYQPFYRKRTDEERALDRSRVYTVRINGQEKADLIECMKLLRQAKRGTAMKQLMRIGMQSVLHDEKTRALLGIVSNNERKNEKLGIVDVKQEINEL